MLNACENQGQTYPYQYHDATILGPIHEDVASIPLRLGGGSSCNDKRWPVKKQYATYADLIEEMSLHVVGTKDGLAFMQGNAIGNERRVPAIKELCVMGLDVDSGVDPAAVIDRIAKRGLTAIIYTTHSHTKSETYLLASSFTNFCKKHRIEVAAQEYPLAIVKRFLIEERKWESWIVNTVSIGEPTQEAEGMGVWLHHDPMPKFRAVFPLAEPYVIAKQGLSQLDAVKKWKRKLVGLARSLDLPIDESCLDPSRLFYLPRHKDGAPFGVWVTGGDALDFESVPEGAINGDRQSDTFMRNGEQLAGTGVPEFVVNGNFSLKKWAAQKAEGFDIATMFDAVAPHKIRCDQSRPGKRTIECPFDLSHSNPEDLEDKGCFIESARPEEGKSFAFQCSHNACKGRDRLEFVAEAVTQGWFTTDDLENEAYRPFIVEETDEEKLAKLEKHIEALTLDTRASDLDPLFASLGSLDIPIARRDGLFDKICAKIGVKGGNDKRSLKSRLTPHVKAAETKCNKASQSDGENEAIKALAKESGDKPVLIPKVNGFMPCVDAAFERLLEINKTKPTYFCMGGQKIVMNVDSRGDIESFSLEPEIMLTELDHECAWYAPDGDDFIKSECPPRVANDIINYRKREFPRLERISRAPLFAAGGTLIKTEGYHEESGVYCALAPELKNLSVPDDPTPEEVADAVGFVNEHLFANFPFNDGDGNGDASRANAWALFLERYVREDINGFVPLYMIDKIQKGTGGSLLSQCIMMTAIGKAQPAMPFKKNEEEQHKVLTSFFINGGEFFYIDNLTNKLAGAAMAMALTLREWQDRILGTNKMANLPVRNSWVVAGNQLNLDDDMSRRCVPIKLKTKGDPTKRNPAEFRHPNLEAWVLENRCKLVECALTIIQAWYAANKPVAVNVPHFASYEAYAKVMGGILQNAKITGFLENLHLAKAAAKEDRWIETEVLRALFERFGDDIREIGDPDKDATLEVVQMNPKAKDKRTSFINVILDAEIDIPDLGLDDLDLDGKKKAQRLGSWFKTMKLAEVAIEIAPGLDVALEIIPTEDRKRNPRGKSNLYRVECVGFYPNKATDRSRRLFSRVFDWKHAADEFRHWIEEMGDEVAV
ncbi:hypothetical protein [Methylosinus sp. KRF6]|uniref:hypothetical protein n=1 Tax=Methylosinus sp. KRF6 TaxID=2846853 RepID=UPI001C0B6B15|nr:hypothetical protein [Methylosinus sp. KRF6]MBU3887582.1 hypothetical protein [Methylosinus sp. KRF6]